MRSSRISIGFRRPRLAAASVVGLLLLAPVALAQDAAPQPAPPAAPKNPGLFESMGRWFDQGASNFRDHLTGAKRRMDDLSDQAAANNKELSEQAAKVGQGAADVGKGAVDATKSAVDFTKSAVDAVVKLPTARMTTGRERCAVAPNGAPDCLSAAEMLCRKQGFSTGKSLDFTSAEECPPSTLLGQKSRDECYTVTFISRAMCQ
ncbi:MAG: hypothetical protein WCG92_01235 [Hyphomicrobiales bacterium]